MNRRIVLAGLAAATAASTLGVPPAAGAADPTALQMGTMPTDGSAQPFYGLDRNFYKDAGFDVKLTILNNTASLASAVASGALEIGFGSVVPLAQAHLRGLNFKVIAPATIYDGKVPVNVIMVGKNSTVQKAADLNGQTVAVNGLRDLTQYEMQAWIDKNGGDVKSVKLIETPFSEMAVALDSGRVAAGILAEPFWTAALSTCRVIGNGSAAVANHFMVTGWFATTDWLAKNADTAKRVQTTMLQIAKWANANHPESQTIVPKYTKITPDVAAHMVRAVLGEAKPDVTLVQPVIDVAVKYGGMQSVPAAELIWQG
jgi:NitT/TauT family transport system substrate-binding protein